MCNRDIGPIAYLRCCGFCMLHRLRGWLLRCRLPRCGVIIVNFWWEKREREVGMDVTYCVSGVINADSFNVKICKCSVGLLVYFLEWRRKRKLPSSQSDDDEESWELHFKECVEITI